MPWVGRFLADTFSQIIPLPPARNVFQIKLIVAVQPADVDVVLYFKAEQVAVKCQLLPTVRIKQHTHDFGVQRSGGLQ